MSVDFADLENKLDKMMEDRLGRTSEELAKEVEKLNAEDRKTFDDYVAGSAVQLVDEYDNGGGEDAALKKMVEIIEEAMKKVGILPSETDIGLDLLKTLW